MINFKRLWIQVLVLGCLMSGLMSCGNVPITGRMQLNFVPASLMNSMSLTSYEEFLKENKVSTNVEQTAMVKRCGERIQKAVEAYCKQNDLMDEIEGYEWEFNLVEDDAVNAWCMPGGKVVVYTGLLPVAQDEAGLAAVMGHEIAHAIAKHGAERMSQGLVASMGGIALERAMKDKPEKTKALFLGSYGVAANYGVILPFSRLHENEADHLGVIFMAMAGYDPHEAVDFWQRMADSKDGQAVPELLSTHPSDEHRIENIKKILPEAMIYYNKSKTTAN